jgi:hypothetical protein
MEWVMSLIRICDVCQSNLKMDEWDSFHLFKRNRVDKNSIFEGDVCILCYDKLIALLKAGGILK